MRARGAHPQPRGGRAAAVIAEGRHRAGEIAAGRAGVAPQPRLGARAPRARTGEERHARAAEDAPEGELPATAPQAGRDRGVDGPGAMS